MLRWLLCIIASALLFQWTQEPIYTFSDPSLNKAVTKKWHWPSLPFEYNHMRAGHPKLSSNSYFSGLFPPRDRTQVGVENATLVMLARNLDLEGALSSMRLLEDRFNHQYKYPWVFMNEVPFDEEFIEQTTLMASGEVYYELIPMEDWGVPPHIDRAKLQENIQKASRENMIYGFSKAYRNMCHFNLGYFYKQKRLLNYDWYFRVEPDVEYMCDFQYDPFTLLRERNKQYGFVIAIHEYENTIPTLWDTVESFMEEYPELLHPNNSLDFVTSREASLNSYYSVVDSKSGYNLCHFWSNFEIGNLNFFRGKAYETFFHHLDMAGGFYYERWGDAPVHTLGLALLLDKDQIHHFEDIGYYHAPYMACPTSQDVKTAKRCICKTIGGDPKVLREPIDIEPFSCLARWWRYGSGKTFLNDVDYSYGPPVKQSIL